jgi:hypothetical protein
MKRAGVNEPAIQVLVAIVAGIALWRLYSWLAAQVLGRLRRYIAEDPQPL